MRKYFKIRYEFDREQVLKKIADQVAAQKPDYVCVADGVILNIASRNDSYLDVINSGMFCICDSSYVPLYVRLLYGERYEQYCGSQIFHDIVTSGNYKMAFLGASREVLNGLRKELSSMNREVKSMLFHELPFMDVNDFDYPAIAKMLEEDGADIIWIALGAPKQEIFMNKLRPHLKKGVMIAVGAAFKFYCGLDVKRAPQWMVKNHLEFVHRLCCEPKKQSRRCYWIVKTLPRLLYEEWRRKRTSSSYTSNIVDDQRQVKCK